MKNKHCRLRERGSALVSIIIVLPFLLLTSALYMELSVSSLNVSRKDQAHTRAQFAVDAGLDFALQKINDGSGWIGTGGEVELHNEGGTKTTYEVSLVENSPESRTLIAIGRAFQPAGSSSALATKQIRVELRPVASAGYSVVTGVGGLYMSNSAKILGGDVFVNGEINMSNTTQIGLVTNPLKVEVAHQNCPNPADANYPRLCGSGENGQPITIQNSARIYGDVKANNQTNGAGMTNNGLVASSGVVPQALPTHDRAAQITAVASTISASTASCNSNGGTRTWAANLKIEGDVNVSKNCKVTIEGNIWITGKLNLSNSAQLIVSGALGSTMPDIMVDGSKVTFTNSSSIVANSTGTGARLLTYWSNATCSPSCTNVTGADLYNSRNSETISFSNSAAAPQSTLYARWTRVSVKNSGGIGALVGQTVALSNNATITFGSSAGSGITYWVQDGYRRSN